MYPFIKYESSLKSPLIRKFFPDIIITWVKPTKPLLPDIEFFSPCFSRNTKQKNNHNNKIKSCYKLRIIRKTSYWQSTSKTNSVTSLHLPFFIGICKSVHAQDDDECFLSLSLSAALILTLFRHPWKAMKLFEASTQISSLQKTNKPLREIVADAASMMLPQRHVVDALAVMLMMITDSLTSNLAAEHSGG